MSMCPIVQENKDFNFKRLCGYCAYNGHKLIVKITNFAFYHQNYVNFLYSLLYLMCLTTIGERFESE